MVRKQMFSLEASGFFQQNGFIVSSRVDSEHITRTGVVNGADSKIFNLTLFAKLHFTNWWELQMNHTYSYSFYGFDPAVNASTVSGNSYNLWASMDFTFWKKTVLEVGGWYNTRGVQPQGAVLAVGVLNASIKKSFFKDKLSISIAAHNILNSMKWGWVATHIDLLTQGSWQNIDRNVMFTLTYRFGSGKPADRKVKEADERLDGGGKGR